MTRLLIVMFLGSVALAQQAKTEAESLFEKAWWEETASGALDKALEGYKKAADATGPSGIRARSLYRAAIVEQRLGKTDAAVALLERLAKEFPGETDLLKEAKARLQEWTAVDLRKSFSEWYQSYVFSPEFQARVVDLVLRMGTANENQYQEEWNQLLTIGAASVPALEEALKGSNEQLRRRATELLLRLGVVPPTDALVRYQSWMRNGNAAWLTLFHADEATRRRVREEVKGDTSLERAVRAVVTSPEAMLAYVRSATDRDHAGAVLTLLAYECGDATRKEVVGLLRDPAVPELVSGYLIAIYNKIDIDLHQCIDWARTLPTESARGVAAYWAAMKLTEKSDEDLDAVLALVPDPDRGVSHAGYLVLTALSNQPRIGKFAWTPARVRLLVDVSLDLDRSRSEEGGRASQPVIWLLQKLMSEGETASALADALLDRAARLRETEANLGFGRTSSLVFVDAGVLVQLGQKRSWRDLFGERLIARWPKASLQDKVALLDLARQASGLGQDVARGLGDVLVKEATARGADPELQNAILSLIGRVPVAAVLAPFDLSRPEDVDAAVETLGRLRNRVSRDERTVASMVEILIHGKSDARRAALQILKDWTAEKDPALLPAAKELVADDASEVRLWAVNRLCAWDSFDASPYLVKALGDADAEVRAAAAAGLARLGREDAVPALVKLLDDSNPAVREAALKSLEAIRKIVDLKKEWLLEQAGRK